jgi:hypothetical protein
MPWFVTTVEFSSCSAFERHFGQAPINEKLWWLVGFLFFRFLRRPIHQRPLHFTLLNPLCGFNGFQPKEESSWAENAQSERTLGAV